MDTTYLFVTGSSSRIPLSDYWLSLWRELYTGLRAESKESPVVRKAEGREVLRREMPRVRKVLSCSLFYLGKDEEWSEDATRIIRLLPLSTQFDWARFSISATTKCDPKIRWDSSGAKGESAWDPRLWSHRWIWATPCIFSYYALLYSSNQSSWGATVGGMAQSML